MIVLLGALETRVNEVEVLLWCGDASLGLLLKGVRNVDTGGEAYGVHGSKGVSVKVFDHFEDASA